MNFACNFSIGIGVLSLAGKLAFQHSSGPYWDLLHFVVFLAKTIISVRLCRNVGLQSSDVCVDTCGQRPLSLDAATPCSQPNSMCCTSQLSPTDGDRNDVMEVADGPTHHVDLSHDEIDLIKGDNIVLSKAAATFLVEKAAGKGPRQKRDPLLKRQSKHGWLIDGKGYRVEEEDEDGLVLKKAVCLLCPEKKTCFALSSRKNPRNTSWRSAVSHMEVSHDVKNADDLAAFLRGDGPSKRQNAFQDIRAFVQQYAPKSPEYTRRKTAVARWVAWENMPLSIGERQGFIHFMRTFDHRWPKISKRTVTRCVQQQAEECVSKISEEMKRVAEDTDVSWTTDCWSSNSTDRYITMTLHYIDRSWTPVTRVLGTTSFNETHSAHNICKVMKRMRLKYGLPPRTASEQVFDTEEEMWEAEHRYDRPCITTDLGADISAGVERDERWDWNRCICHCLNLAMTAACKVEAVASILHEMRSLASRLKRSPAEWSKFKEIQWEWIRENQAANTPEAESNEEGGAATEDEDEAEVTPIREEKSPRRPLRLLLPVPTRWNSWFYCLKRVLELETPIKRYLTAMQSELRRKKQRSGKPENDEELEVPSISEDHWPTLHQLTKVMEPIKEMSMVLEGDSYCTISLVLPMSMHLLYRRLPKARHFTSRICAEFVDAFKVKFLDVLDDVEQVNLWTTCSCLDHRVKDLKFTEDIWKNPSDWPKTTERWSSQNALKHSVWKDIKGMLEHGAAVLHVGSSDGEAVGSSEEENPVGGWLDFEGEQDARSAEPNTSEQFPSPATGARVTRGKARHVSKRKQPPNPLSQELSWYKSHVEDSKLDVLPWWKSNCGQFPNLAKLARRRLSAQASSACSERSFSKAGLIVTKKRMALRPENVDGLSLLGWSLMKEHDDTAKRRQSFPQDKESKRAKR